MACYLPRPALALEGLTGGEQPFRLRPYPNVSQNFAESAETTCLPPSPQLPVPKLCQNPSCLVCRELLFEREQLPQVIDNKHFRIELIEHLEPVIVLRNQQVAGSIPAGGSIKSVG
jgi:hypothetical protein